MPGRNAIAILGGMSNPIAPYRFFLGGADLEMAAIRALVEETLGQGALCDHRLGWGARLSDYQAELAALPRAVVPVLVELTLDQDPPERAIIVDHHGDRTDKPSALHQVFALLAPLGLPSGAWTRRMDLVAANDRGHVRAMRALGASPAEIASIRTADRAAQGITPDEERIGEAALAAAESRLDGRLTLVRLPHARTATVMDRIAVRTPEAEIRDVLILCPAEVNFYGSGAAVLALDSAFPQGWRGGELPTTGFWGHGAPMPDEAALLRVLTKALSA